MSASPSQPSSRVAHADDPPETAVMSDSEFHARAHEVLAAIEATLDRWLQEDEIDIDSQRTGGLLELQFPSGSKIVVNTQPPLHELWLAARTGGYHFRLINGAVDRFAQRRRVLCHVVARDQRAGRPLVGDHPLAGVSGSSA